MHDQCAEVVIYRSLIFFFQLFLVLIIIVHETFCGSKIVACQDKRDEWMILSHIGSRSYLDVTFLCILKWEEVIVVNRYSDTVSNSIKLCVRCLMRQVATFAFSIENWMFIFLHFQCHLCSIVCFCEVFFWKRKARICLSDFL